MALVGVVREETMKKPWVTLTPKREVAVAEAVAFATAIAKEWRLAEPLPRVMAMLADAGEHLAPHGSRLQALRWCLEHPGDYQQVIENLERRRHLIAS
jgi:hypothetical protein